MSEGLAQSPYVAARVGSNLRPGRKATKLHVSGVQLPVIHFVLDWSMFDTYV